MKKLILSVLGLSFICVSAQFKIEIYAEDTFAKQKVFIYTQSGSKDFIISHADKTKEKWEVNIPKEYKGMMRAYFPENAQSVSFISENEDIKIKLGSDLNKIKKIQYIDKANKKWEEMIALEQQKGNILPILLQIKNFYKDNDQFYPALKDEILRLEKTEIKVEKDSFLEFYLEAMKYANGGDGVFSTKDYKSFLMNSNEMLEASSLIKPILINFLRSIPRESLTQNVDRLLEELNLETNRGQVVLSELLSVFDTYGLTEEKERYYKQASALACSVNKNLETSISAIKNTSIGAKFQDHSFTSNVKNTKAKKISDVIADKKLVLFWSSACPHCVSELPIILENYGELKQKNIEIIAFSLDSDALSYEEKTTALPWINDAELKGWRSSYVEKYNISATPTYYVLDSKGRIIDKPANFSVFLKTINAK
ncbi:MAG: TlpA disulfide reductase family protein [Flavobacteriaceae bacterium]|nr:TlpA disulfide reductase family protein [Flavobacteriaceae bacterium]